MSKFHRSVILFLLVVVVMPALLGLGCDNSGGEKIGPKVDRAFVDTVKSVGDGIQPSGDLARCVVNGSGVFVCAGGN